MSEPPKTIQDVPTPAFLVDIDKVKRNCQRMIDRCRHLGIKLRPHMKTHKTIRGGELMTGGTKRQIVVSTLKEAEFYADAGFDDIIYGVLFTRDKLPRLRALSLRLEKFHVMLDSDYAIKLLEDNPLPDGKPWSVFLLADCGDNREGVAWDGDTVVALARRLQDSKSITFQGLYVHDGHSYHAQGQEAIRACADDAADKIAKLAERLKAEGIRVDNYGTGSTPSSSVPGEKARLLTEMHPGNYIFYDAWQALLIGSCDLDDVAVRVATRVTGHYPDKNLLLVDCGFLGISHDGKGQFGRSNCVVQGHPDLELVDMSQEIGKMQSKSGTLNYPELPIGSMLLLYPYHACATAANHPVYYVHSGDKIVDMWYPCRGW